MGIRPRLLPVWMPPQPPRSVYPFALKKETVTMSMLEEVLETIGATAAGWETEGEFGEDDNLIAPDGCVIEQDGQCQHGHISPLRTAGLI